MPGQVEGLETVGHPTPHVLSVSDASSSRKPPLTCYSPKPSSVSLSSSRAPAFVSFQTLLNFPITEFKPIFPASHSSGLSTTSSLPTPVYATLVSLLNECSSLLTSLPTFTVAPWSVYSTQKLLIHSKHKPGHVTRRLKIFHWFSIPLAEPLQWPPGLSQLSPCPHLL